MQTTINQLAKKMNCDRQLVYGLIKFLEHRGLAKEVGKEKASGGRGKPSIVYEVPDTVNFKMVA
jgi:predicted transcriptional regulator